MFICSKGTRNSASISFLDLRTEAGKNAWDERHSLVVQINTQIKFDRFNLSLSRSFSPIVDIFAYSSISLYFFFASCALNNFQVAQSQICHWIAAYTQSSHTLQNDDCVVAVAATYTGIFVFSQQQKTFLIIQEKEMNETGSKQREREWERSNAISNEFSWVYFHRFDGIWIVSIEAILTRVALDSQLFLSPLNDAQNMSFAFSNVDVVSKHQISILIENRFFRSSPPPSLRFCSPSRERRRRRLFSYISIALTKSVWRIRNKYFVRQSRATTTKCAICSVWPSWSNLDYFWIFFCCFLFVFIIDSN